MFFEYAASSNKKTIKVFFKNLKTLVELYDFTSSNIFNLDEAFLFTAGDASKVNAPRKTKLLTQMTPQRRRIFVSMLVFVYRSGKKNFAVFWR